VSIELEPVAHVRGGRAEVLDDHWGTVESCIELAPHFETSALRGLESFSHLYVLYFFHRVDPASIEPGARHPRDNPAWPRIGIFAQRGKSRPNRLGLSVCEILRIEGPRVFVRGLDAVDGTPVLDLKPAMRGFEPRGTLREPPWAAELMSDYW
jgi:tRNA-Thr(GGU) m(6)t(6)A37 methyltransferase TsaA